MCKNVCLLHLVLCLDWVGGIIASLSRSTDICNEFTFAVCMKSFLPEKKDTSKWLIDSSMYLAYLHDYCACLPVLEL